MEKDKGGRERGKWRKNNRDKERGRILVRALPSIHRRGPVTHGPTVNLTWPLFVVPRGSTRRGSKIFTKQRKTRIGGEEGKTEEKKLPGKLPILPSASSVSFFSQEQLMAGSFSSMILFSP